MGSSLHGGLVAGREIETSGGAITVRGLSGEAIFGLITRHRENMNVLYERILAASTGSSGNLNAAQMSELLSWLLGQAPAIASEAIAAACGDVTAESVAIAHQLPFPVQLAIVEAAVAQTFTSEMPPKKVWETVVSLLAGAQQSLAPQVGQPA